ncbi:hypothetical protein GCM10009639_26310 [Kitasatospora putterlickiae]|uniref:Antibiotic biosynthesis monooxygenase n=1 Tax=Kitasatospora putterlickiae TaxID=221725 RepID=A0ABN1Y169_9ACTN
MLEITVRTENDETHPRPGVEALAGLVRRIGAKRDRFLVVERRPDEPDVYVQVWHEEGENYTLEYRDGGPDKHFQVLLDDPEPVITAMTAWARREPGWGEGHAWEALELP